MRSSGGALAGRVPLVSISQRDRSVALPQFSREGAYLRRAAAEGVGQAHCVHRPPPAIVTPEAMTKRMDAAFDGLRAAIFEMYAAMVENDSRDGAEHQRRAHALEGIDEILEWRPLASFSARHLELLELLFAYWREAEIEGEVRAPSPDPIQ